MSAERPSGVPLHKKFTPLNRRHFGITLSGALIFPVQSFAAKPVFEDFGAGAENRWRFFADTVMGGISSGEVTFKRDISGTFARMTGTVSTANNGGFIQFRRLLQNPLPRETKGLRLIVRGNRQRYFVHLRTTGTFLPWQYYQSDFDANQEWSEVWLPLINFKASGGFMRSSPTARSLRSVGVVAYGRDHEAQIDVREIDFY